MSKQKIHESAALHVATSIGIGVVSACIAGSIIGWQYAPLVGWDIAAVVFLLWVVVLIRGMNGEQTSKHASVEDPGRTIADILLTCASIASLGAVVAMLLESTHAIDTTKTLEVGLATLSIIISWFLVHTIYTLKYTRQYYQNDGGIDFYDKALPRYSDFAYIAFTIGMTFQVSDNTFSTNAFRRMVIKHALLSYLFGTVILASVINFIVGLGK